MFYGRDSRSPVEVEVFNSFPRPEEIVQISDGILADLENFYFYFFSLIPGGKALHPANYIWPPVVNTHPQATQTITEWLKPIKIRRNLAI